MDKDICAPLPPEVWERVFSLLHSEEDLIICRKVCLSWERILEKLPPPQIWSPFFSKHHTAEAMLTFRHTRGTLLESKEDLFTFLLEAEQRPPAHRKSNPFINSTLILNWRSVGEYHGLHRELLALVRRHGNHVHKLLYFIHEFVPQSMESIPEILKNMGNLRSLIISCPQSDYKLISSRFRFPELPKLKHFRELEILGMENKFLLKLLLKKYGPQLRSLYWWDSKTIWIPNDWRFIVGLCPNLRNLKFLNSDFHGDGIISSGQLQSIQFPVALKRFAYKGYSKESRDSFGNEFNAVMNIAARFSATLEVMTLYVKVVSEEGIGFALSNLPEFPLLKELAIPFSFLRSSILPQLLGKLGNVRKLIFLDTEDNFQNRFVGKEELDQIFQGLWAQIPSSIEEISIRSRMFHRELQRHFPVYHKCSNCKNFQ
ncbi:unnamed protein product [Orchesella dallaii]|uniref:F-box domain-containing protein n=1 Tax=Orchesella dallaii TaxID=48710 RepID=A0ABP1RP52_9HEXA